MPSPRDLTEYEVAHASALSRAAHEVAIGSADRLAIVSRLVREHLVLEHGQAPDLDDILERLDQITLDLTRFAVTHGWTGDQP
ncbi:hypothetical protein [Demequina capsici]|uniref:Uncharacterized protein n=1 Tax=Demequina capsici TaxID=3075620 RepID=A0AA96F8J9_9MICO|nr:hypothetical protein [Demequina sp. OYTSA14]WNM25234.1 hypothetical protein RN606_03545 [Demequina sp. OYTSA14]